MRVMAGRRVVLFLFLPAVLLAALLGSINLGAFYQLQAEHQQEDAQRLQALRETAEWTEVTVQLSALQQQIEDTVGQPDRSSDWPDSVLAALQHVQADITRRFPRSPVSPAHSPLITAVQAYLQAVQQVVEAPEMERPAAMARAYEQQRHLLQVHNTLVAGATGDLLSVWQEHNTEFTAHTHHTMLIGGLSIVVLLVLWLGLIWWLSRDLLRLTEVMQQLAQSPDGLAADELATAAAMVGRSNSLIQGLAAAILAFQHALQTRAKAQHELRKLSLVVEQNPNAVVVTDLQGSIEYVNDAFVRMTGYSRDWILGRNPRVLRSGKTPRATYDAMWQKLLQGESWQGEFINHRRDGSEMIEAALIVPLRQSSGEITHYVAVKSDITRHKKMEEELARYHSHLEQVVLERTRALSQAKASAEQASHRQSEFLGNVTQELQQPLTGVVEVLYRLREARDAGTQAALLEQADHQVQRLLGQLNNLSVLSLLERGALPSLHSRFNLERLIETVREQLAFPLREHSIVLCVEMEPLSTPWHGDAVRLQQVLCNLMEYLLEGIAPGTVTLRVRIVSLLSAGRVLRIEIHDGNRHVSEPLPSSGRQPWQLSEEVPIPYDGKELGLWVSRQWVAHCGGQMGFEYHPERGRSIWLTLPLSGEQEPEIGDHHA